MSNSTYLEPDDFSLQRSEEFRERMQKEQDKETESYYQKRFIDKACKWLERNAPFGVVSHERVWDMVQEFRKAMEE